MRGALARVSSCKQQTVGSLLCGMIRDEDLNSDLQKHPPFSEDVMPGTAALSFCHEVQVSHQRRHFDKRVRQIVVAIVAFIN